MAATTNGTATAEKPVKVKAAKAPKAAAAPAPAANANYPKKPDGKPIAEGWANILRYLYKRNAVSRNTAVSKGEAVEKGGLKHGGFLEMADGYNGEPGLVLLNKWDAEGEVKTTHLTTRFSLTAGGKAAAKKL